MQDDRLAEGMRIGYEYRRLLEGFHACKASIRNGEAYIGKLPTSTFAYNGMVRTMLGAMEADLLSARKTIAGCAGIEQKHPEILSALQMTFPVKQVFGKDLADLEEAVFRVSQRLEPEK